MGLPVKDAVTVLLRHSVKVAVGEADFEGLGVPDIVFLPTVLL